MSSTVYSATFYTGTEIPDFNATEKSIFQEFGIAFKKLPNSKRVIKDHNKEVLKIIAEHGTQWRHSLMLDLKNERAEIQRFIRYLTSNTGFDINDRIDITISYHLNGIIGKRVKRIALSGTGGGMYHIKYKTQFWGKQGQKLRSERRVERGSWL